MHQTKIVMQLAAIPRPNDEHRPRPHGAIFSRADVVAELSESIAYTAEAIYRSAEAIG